MHNDKIDTGKDNLINNQLFEDNEMRTNRIVAALALIFIVIFCINLIFNNFNHSKTMEIGNIYIMPIVSAIVILMDVTALLYKFAKPWIKYMLLIGVTFGCCMMFFIYSIFAIYVFLFPVILAARYYDRRVILVEAAVDVGMFVITCILELVGQNSSGIMQTIHDYTTYNPWESPMDAFEFVIMPVTIVIIAVMAFAISITNNGRRFIATRSADAAVMSRVETELSMALSIQQSALPEESYTCENGAFTISAREIPAKEVGGDFYDYFMLDKHLLVFMVADVSDKGVPSAMFMMSSIKAIRCCLLGSYSMEQAAAFINKQLCMDNKSGMILTLWLGTVDTLSGQVRYINAGHLPPVIRHADGTAEFIENEPDLFLGTFPDMTPQVHTFRMKPGDTIVLYTDGITDAMNTEGESYGMDRLLSKIKNTGACSTCVSLTAVNDVDLNNAASRVDSKNETNFPYGKSSDESENKHTSDMIISDNIMKDAMDFIGEADQFDDMTLLSITCNVLEEPATWTMTVPSDDTGTSLLNERINTGLISAKCPDDIRRNVEVILDEICTNINDYAYSDGNIGNEQRTITLTAAIAHNYIEMEFADNGIPFDPLSHEDPEFSDEPSIGGLGIYLVKSLSQEQEYEYRDSQNHLRVRVLWYAFENNDYSVPERSL